MPSARVLWFRRDLRLADNPALREAAAADEVVPLYVVDPALWGPAGDPRRAYLVRSLRALDERLDGRLLVVHGDPGEVVPAVARESAAAAVHVAADFGPYGRARDARVEARLGADGVGLARTGSPYAVAPGRVTKPDGTPYRVFTPFARAWRQHGWRAPAPAVRDVGWVRPRRGDGIPAEPDLGGTRLPPAGEAAARARWRSFLDGGLDGYAERRNRPDLDTTSQLSVHLKWGEVHPRTLLADLAERSGTSVDTYRNELCWREFYADVLWHVPRSAREYLKPELADLGYASGPAAAALFAAWREGRTGYPVVDAAMRQLLAEGWMHNRMRMVVASFLVKDLHLEWQLGARYFMQRLRDGDLASNNHGWQWVAGSGTDAAPFFRIFNPVKQGRTYDPDGDYVRRYVAELREVAGAAVHEPWTLPGGLPPGYPERVVDHAAERAEALRRYEAVAR